MSNSDSREMQLMSKWGVAWVEKNMEHLKEPLHEDFRYIQYPQSLKRQEQTRDEWSSHMEKFMQCWESMDRTTYSVIEAEGKVITHYHGTVKTKFGVEINREAISIATIVNENGVLKIKLLEEFIDSKTDLESIQALEAVMFKN